MPEKKRADLDSITKEIECLVANKKIDEAIKLGQQACELSQRDFGEHLKTVVCLQTLAQLYVTAKNYPEAEPPLMQAIGIVQKTHGEDHPDAVSAKILLSEVLIEQNKLTKATQLLEELERTCRKAENKDGLYDVFYNQACIAYNKDQPDKALSLLKEQEALCIELDNEEQLNACLADQKTVQDRIDQDKSLSEFKAQEKASRKANNHEGLREALWNQVLIEEMRGNVDRASELFMEQEDICREMGDKTALQQVLDRHSKFCHDCGKYDEALELLKECEQLCSEMNDASLLAICKANRATMLANASEENNETAVLFEEAYQIAMGNCLDDVAESIKEQMEQNAKNTCEKQIAELFMQAEGLTRNGRNEDAAIAADKMAALCVTEDGSYYDFYPMVFQVISKYYENAGLLKETERKLEKAIEGHLSSQKLPKSNLIKLYTHIAEIQKKLGKFDDADESIRRCFEFIRSSKDEMSPEYADALCMLASMDRKHAKQKYLHQKAINIIREILGTGHPRYALALNNLGEEYLKRGKYEKAEPLLREALEIRKKTLGTNDYYYSTSLQSLGSLYASLGQERNKKNLILKGLDLLQKALEIRRTTLPPKDRRIIPTIANVASIHASLEDFPKADSLYREALELFRTTGSVHDIDYVELIYTIGSFYETNNKIELSVPLWQEAIEISRQIKAENLKTYSLCLLRLGWFYYTNNDHKSAIPLLTEYMQRAGVETSTIGNDYINCGMALAQIHTLDQGFDEAIEYWEKVVPGIKKHYGQSSIQYADYLRHTAILNYHKDELLEAENRIDEGLEIAKKVLERNNPHLISFVGIAALICRALGRLAEAVQLTKEMSEIAHNTSPESLEESRRILYEISTAFLHHGAEDLSEKCLNLANSLASGLDEADASHANKAACLLQMAKRFSEWKDNSVTPETIKEHPSAQVSTRTINAYLMGDYELCLRQASAFQGGKVDNVFHKIVLISLYRLGKQHDSYLKMLIDSLQHDPFELTIVQLIEGNKTLENALSEWSKDDQKIKIRYYAATRMILNGQLDDAVQLLEAIISDDPMCIEQVLAHEELKSLREAQRISFNDIVQKLRKMVTEASSALASGQSANALAIAKKAKRLAQTRLIPGHPGLGDCLLLQARLYQILGRDELATSLAAQGLDILYKALGPEHPECIEVRNWIQQLYYVPLHAGEWEKALKRMLICIPYTYDDVQGSFLLQCLESLCGSPKYPDYVSATLKATLDNTALHAIVRVAVGRTMVAEVLPLLKTDQQRCQAHYYGGLRLKDQGKLKEADDEFKACRRIRCKSLEREMVNAQLDGLNLKKTETKGEPIFDDIGAAIQSVFENQKKGQGPKTLKLIDEAAALVEQRIDEGDIRAVVFYRELTRIAFAAGDVERALDLVGRVIDIADACGDKKAQAVAAIDLGQIMWRTGNAEKAKESMKKGIACLEKIGVEHDPMYLKAVGDLAAICNHTGDFDKVEPLLQRILGTIETIKGSHHPEYEKNLRELAIAAAALGKKEKARELFKRTFDINRQLYGEEHINTLDNLRRLVEVIGLEDAETAAPLQRDLLRILKKMNLDNDGGYALHLIHYGRLCQELRDDKGAEEAYRQSLEMLRPSKDKTRIQILVQTLGNLAKICKSTNRHSEAEQFILETVDITKSQYGVNHTEYGKALNNLALFYDETGDKAKAEPLYKRAMAILYGT